MNCLEFNNYIYDYCDGSLSSDLQFQITEHMGECQACRNNYHLTMLENEMLSDVSDIPPLSSHFTTQLMAALPSDKWPKSQATTLQMNKNVSRRAQSTTWLSSLAAIAVIIALCIYWPNLTNRFNQVNIAGNYDTVKQQTAVMEKSTIMTDSSSSTPADIVIDAPKQELSDTPAAPLTDQMTKTNAVINKPVQIAAGEVKTAQPIPSALAGSEVIKRSVIQEVDRSIRADNQSFELDLQFLVPHNVPERFKLIQKVNNGGKEAVYNYASQDEKENFQLKLVPYVELITATGPMSNVSTLGSVTSVSKDIQVGDKKITVTYSGNLPEEGLSKLADTIQFEQEIPAPQN